MKEAPHQRRKPYKTKLRRKPEKTKLKWNQKTLITKRNKKITKKIFPIKKVIYKILCRQTTKK
jgi:hypothetical protein